MKKSLLGLFLGLCISLTVVGIAGENPLNILKIFFNSAFGSSYDLGLVLFYSTSFVLTGLSVAFSFHAGMFNIGAEGQLTFSALGLTIFALTFPHLPFPASIILAITVSILFGSFWGFIPGYLKAKRGSHEVIITMMMNFIAAAISSYLILNLFKNPESQNPESSKLSDSYLFAQFDPSHSWTQDSPFNLTFFIAVILSILIWFVLYKTVFGFELRTVGQNEIAAKIAGINTKFYKYISLTISGSLASFAAINEILGATGKYKLGFSAEFGFIGIAVSLLARNNPLGIIFSGILFGILQKGSADLDLETEFITKDFSKIIQAIIILSVITIYSMNTVKLLSKRTKGINQ